MTHTLANAGLPMIFVHGPVFIVGLIPIIAIEAVALKIFNRHASLKKCLTTAGSSNIMSTIIGLPLTWLLLVFIQMIAGGGGNMPDDTIAQRFFAMILQAPWQLPYRYDLIWMVPRAAIVMLVPFFFVSYFIERRVTQSLMQDSDQQEIHKGVLWGNITSYTFLAGFWIMVLFAG
jgi:hypothetical protein